MGDGENVVVAVRVRPFNDREKKLNSKLIIDMPDSKRTAISDPNDPNADPKWFTFDHSYWSHDGFREASNGYVEPANGKYADQKRVFDDLGQGVLDNAWKGYNCSLFAYGQTGSGKSYSMVGPKNNQGIIPIVCEELFKRIDEAKKSKPETEFQVSISMFEIYCEKVRDLLSTKTPPKGGLKVREHPKTGFYVENLTSYPVGSYKEIARKIDEGTKSRSIAATNMNATSSRAHTIVKIHERQRDAGSEGDRLKEGIVINQSLSTLGRVIKALHEQQTAKGKKGKIIQVPYRDSVLTSLLKNALGGNSKTIMIAALSPADVNYEETLSTLRFADRTKSIKTKAVINESATERMIRELREENARLQELMKGGGTSGGASSEELESLRRQLEENQKEMASLELTWQQKLEEAKRRESVTDERVAQELKRKSMCHLWNLNEDSALTDIIVHFIEVGQVTVGNKNASPPSRIVLNGLSIQPQHAVFTNKDNKKVTLTPLSGAEILVNGKRIDGETELGQNDRILLGGNHLYVFCNPTKSGASKSITFDQAQAEIAQNSGITGLGKGRSKADLILEEELISLLPQVYRANAMAKELGRKVTFEIVLVAPEARGASEGLTQTWIKVRNEAEDTNFLWEKTRFLSRYSGMQEMYQAKAEGDADWNLPKERDPFYEPPDSEVFVGSSVIFLQSLAFLVELEEQFPIFDFQGDEMGTLSVAISPTSPSGKEIKGQFVEDPNQLIGKDLGFKVRILCAYGLPQRIYKSCCKYRFFGEKEATTSQVSGASPSYAHEANYVYRPVTKELVNYLKNANLYITVYGTQKGRSRSRHLPTPPPRNEALREKANRVQRVERLVDEAKKADNKNLSVKALSTVLDGEVAATTEETKPRRKSSTARRKKSTSKTSRDKSAGTHGSDEKPKRKKTPRKKKPSVDGESPEKE